MFLIRRDFGIISEQELKKKTEQSKEACYTIPEIRWVRSYLALEKENKITYCIYEAPDPETIIRQAKKADIPVDTIILLETELEPDMI